MAPWSPFKTETILERMYLNSAFQGKIRVYKNPFASVFPQFSPVKLSDALLASFFNILTEAALSEPCRLERWIFFDKKRSHNLCATSHTKCRVRKLQIILWFSKNDDLLSMSTFNTNFVVIRFRFAQFEALPAEFATTKGIHKTQPSNKSFWI